MGLEGVIDRIISSLRNYKVYSAGLGLEYSFVDREVEARRVLDEREGVVAGGEVTILYGPKGCGKTTLFEAILYALEAMGGNDLDLVIVGSEKEARRVERLYTPRSLGEVFDHIASALNFTIDVRGEVRGFVDLTKLVSIMTGYIAYRLARGRGRGFIAVHYA